MNTQQQKFYFWPALIIVLAIIFTGCGTAANGETATTTETPSTEAPATEAPTTDAPETEAPAVTETPETDAPETEAPSEWGVFEYDTLTTPSGKSIGFEEASWIELLWYKGSKALIKVVDFAPTYLVEIKVVDDLTGQITKISSDDYVILDVQNAYDTVYWYTADRNVWACHWGCSLCKEICTPVLFCTGAIGLSPYGDEREGAIVPAGKGNWAGINEPFDIFTPYGIGDVIDPDPCH